MAWVIDSSHSLVEFTAKHMMITTVRGRFNKFSGTLSLDEQNPEKSYAEGVVELASVDTRDEHRDGHLRSADFFDVEKYPTMTFRSTRVQVAGEDHYKVAGNLTIKDVTREVVFDVRSEGRAQDPWGNERWGFSAQAAINRKNFGLNWNVALEHGGWLVSDEIKISIEVQAIRQPDAPVTEGQGEAEKVLA